MEITHESVVFWNELEKKSELRIPNHIKNLLHYAGFSSSRLLKNMDEKVISSVENFAREHLFDLLEARCQKQNIVFSPTDKMHFFGEYVSYPDQFKFSDDEKKIIILLSNCANELFESNDINNAFQQMSLHHETDMKCSSNWYFKEHQKPKIAIDLHELPDDIDVEQENTVQIAPQTHTHHIMGKLLATANRNASTTKPGYRFDPEVKKWATYLRMLSGPIAYNTLQQNLNLALPSLSRVNYYVQNTHNTMDEGVLRSQELLLYLRERNLPLVVSLSEDATFIVDRVQFNSKKNQLIGFVLPINRYGMPIPFVYAARNTEEIVSHFAKNKPVAKSVITVMAQPIGNAAPFSILLYGTDSKFNAENVSQRWKFITNNLNDLGIKVLTISSDSDPKYNSGMRKNSRLGRRSEIFDGAEWFKCGLKTTFPFYVQDTVHLGTKLRNLLFKTLKDPTMLQFGRDFIQIAHLQYIADNIPKDQHEITQSVLDPTDRQNFDSVMRICNPKVFALLKKHVKGSSSTIQFLKLAKNFLDAYMDYSLKPLERVSKLWYSLFLIRIWRQFVLDHETLTLKHNFLTSNTYSCMEQNAHSIVLILLYLKDENQPNLFRPWLYSSQPCESFYRQIRAFSPCNSTITNCTVKEIMERVHKIELQNEISCDPTTNFKFHTQKLSHSTSSAFFELPTEEEVLNVINECKENAIRDATEIGLIPKKHRNVHIDCNILPYIRKEKPLNEDETLVDNEEERVFEDSLQILHQLKNVSLKNFADKFKDDEPVNEISPYTEVFGAKKRIVIKKQSLVWLLRKGGNKLSSDRLCRVKTDRREPSKEKKTNRKKNVKYFQEGYLSGKFIRQKTSKNKKRKHLS